MNYAIKVTSEWFVALTKDLTMFEIEHCYCCQI